MTAGGAILSVRGVRLNRGARRILADVSFDVARGELVAIMGSSGSGKTTLLRAIAGLEPFEAGEIAVDGVRLDPGPSIPADRLRALHRKVGMVFQFHCLFEHLSVMGNVCLAPVHVHGAAARDAERRAHTLLEAFGVDHRAEALPRQLSGGEAQRVAIARALAQRPELLLCDEPTGHLDSDTGRRVLDLIDALQRRFGFALVTATHDRVVALRYQRSVQLADGRVIGERRERSPGQT